jgi:hypothetical protein
MHLDRKAQLMDETYPSFGDFVVSVLLLGTGLGWAHDADDCPIACGSQLEAVGYSFEAEDVGFIIGESEIEEDYVNLRPALSIVPSKPRGDFFLDAERRPDGVDWRAYGHFNQYLTSVDGPSYIFGHFLAP